MTMLKKYHDKRRKKRFPPKRNCFAWDHDSNKCIALIKNECEYGACPFFKTPSQDKADREKAEKRLYDKIK